MPQLKSGIQRIKKSKKRYERNVAVKSELKTLVKKVQSAVKNESADELDQEIRKYCSRIDKAQKKGVIHARTAARKKSRAMKKKNTVTKKTKSLRPKKNLGKNK